MGSIFTAVAGLIQVWRLTLEIKLRRLVIEAEEQNERIIYELEDELETAYLEARMSGDADRLQRSHRVRDRLGNRAKLRSAYSAALIALDPSDAGADDQRDLYAVYRRNMVLGKGIPEAGSPVSGSDSGTEKRTGQEPTG